MRGEVHGGPPGTIITWLHGLVKETELGQFFGFDTEYRHLGQFWFEAVVFSIIIVIVLSAVAVLATRRQYKVPTRFQNLLESIVELLNKLVVGLIGPHGTRYLPYLGTLFIYIFFMNILGIIPAFRSPTVTLSTTGALGITTIIVVQIYAIQANGVGGYLKHFWGPIKWIGPLMVIVHIFGELAKPVSLSLRLFGNIFGEDTIIENLLHMGGWVPLHLPMLFFALFTSFLQAFIFTALSSIYIAFATAHENGGERHEGR
jgi:F-type H+-transporting ATPase subunit a